MTPDYNQQPYLTGLVAGILLLQIVALVQWHHWTKRADRNATALLTIFAMAPLAMWMSGFVSTPIFMPRTMLWTVPGLLVILAAGLVKVGGWRAGIVAVSVWAVSLAFSGTMRADRQDPRPILDMIRNAALHGDVLLTCQAWRGAELRAAAREPLRLPLLAPTERGMIMLEPNFGSDPQWISHFAFLVGRPTRIDQLRTITASGRAWLVASNCTGNDLRAIHSWLGLGRWVRIRDDSPDALLPNVLWRFYPTEPPRTRIVTYLASS